jgi:hypothetical protein
MTTTSSNNKINSVEKVAYGIVAIIIIVGIILARVDEKDFRVYISEDGYLEYLTAIMLLIVSIISFYRILTTRFIKGLFFVSTTGFIAVLMLFGFGEEISWGQRIIGFESGAFFEKNNSQHEFNLHNLVYSGIKINKLVFGKILALTAFVYYLILPNAYARFQGCQKFFDNLYVPIPKIHHGIFAVLAILSILLVDSSKKGELNEITFSILLFLTILQPQNSKIYK